MLTHPYRVESHVLDALAEVADHPRRRIGRHERGEDSDPHAGAPPVGWTVAGPWRAAESPGRSAVLPCRWIASDREPLDRQCGQPPLDGVAHAALTAVDAARRGGQPSIISASTWAAGQRSNSERPATLSARANRSIPLGAVGAPGSPDDRRRASRAPESLLPTAGPHCHGARPPTRRGPGRTIRRGPSRALAR